MHCLYSDHSSCFAYQPPAVSITGFQAAVEKLVRAKAEVDKPNKEGCTPLVLAASKGHFVTVQYLLKVTLIATDYVFYDYSFVHLRFASSVIVKDVSRS